MHPNFLPQKKRSALSLQDTSGDPNFSWKEINYTQKIFHIFYSSKRNKGLICFPKYNNLNKISTV